MERKHFRKYIVGEYTSRRLLMTVPQVPRPGSATDSIRGLQLLPDDVLFKIRSVRLVLTTWEFPTAWDHYHCDSVADPLSNLDKFLYFNDRDEEDLPGIWLHKYAVFSRLKLGRFVLDVSDAYAPAGRFLGVEFAQMAPAFDHGIPKDFVIEAPSEVLAKEVRTAIEEVNGVGTG